MGCFSYQEGVAFYRNYSGNLSLRFILQIYLLGNGPARSKQLCKWDYECMVCIKLQIKKRHNNRGFKYKKRMT